MKLEDWEVELKNQFQNNSSTNEPTPVPNTAQSEESVPQPSPETVVTSQDNSNSLPFFILLIILTAAIIYVYDNKTGGKFGDWISSHFSNKPVIEKVENKKVEVEQPKSKPEPQFNVEQKAQLDALQAKVGTLRDKVMLMGLLLNENFNIIKQNDNKDDMVFFNRDWTLDKMPSHIELSDEDKEYLQKYIK